MQYEIKSKRHNSEFLFLSKGEQFNSSPMNKIEFDLMNKKVRQTLKIRDKNRVHLNYLLFIFLRFF